MEEHCINMTRTIKDKGLVFNRVEARGDGFAVVFSDPSVGPEVQIGNTIFAEPVAQENVILLDEG